MAKKPTKSETEEATRLQGYLDAIAKYDRGFKKWEERVKKIIERYRDEGRANTADTNAAKFNILWSNVQTLVPATFARVPQPDVARRFRDQDAVGRVAALILERGLEFETQHYPDYRDTMTQCVHDRFLGGRGTAWVRYEPHFKPGVAPQATEVQITEDVEAEAPEEQLDYECAPVDYVHWKDFGHEICRTWEENTKVWRWVYISEDSVEKRFPEEKFPKLYKDGKCIIPFDSTPEDLKKADRSAQTDVKQQAKICELWDKEAGIAVWFSKSMKEFLDERPDPLKLQQFFPCPKPLYATLTNDTLVPVPDFTLYQDQARTLDTLADRAAGLVNMVQLKGVYDASADASLARLFTEGSNGTLLPVKNWAAFAEKNGLKGSIDVYDLTPISKALEAVYLAADQQKQQVYEIMGISDIVRGSSDPNETLGAQELKGQYASMRLRAMQADVSRFATDLLQIKAQVMCSKFAPQTLVAISAAEQLSEVDKQSVPQALALLVGPERLQDPEAESPNPLRAFRIDVNADSMIQMNEEKDKADRMEFLTAIGTFIEKAAPVVQMAPTAGPLVVEMLKFGVTAFKVGKTVEGKFDELIDQMVQSPASQPVDPEAMKEQALLQAKAEVEQGNATKEIGLVKRAADLDIREMKFQAEQDLKKQQDAMQEQMRAQECEHQAREQEFASREQARELETGVKDKLSKHEDGVKKMVDDVKQENAKAGADEVAVQAAEQKNAKREESLQKLVEKVTESSAQLQQEVAQMAKAISAPKRIVRGKDGRAEGVVSN